MKKTTLLLVWISMSVLFTSCQKEAIDDSPAFEIDLTLAQENDAEFSNEVLILINEHRASLGLSTLKSGSTLATAYAVDHTNYMIDISQVNHDNFPIRSAALETNGAESVGENVAYGYNTPEDVVAAWLNSPGHKDNLEGNYSHASFGIKYSESLNTYYFTHLLYRI